MICHKTSKPGWAKGFTLFEQAIACEFVNPEGWLRKFYQIISPAVTFFCYFFCVADKKSKLNRNLFKNIL
jgi:hypothetical protein